MEDNDEMLYREMNEEDDFYMGDRERKDKNCDNNRNITDSKKVLRPRR